MEHQLNTVNDESLQIGLKINTGKKLIDGKYQHNRQHTNKPDSAEKSFWTGTSP